MEIALLCLAFRSRETRRCNEMSPHIIITGVMQWNYFNRRAGDGFEIKFVGQIKIVARTGEMRGSSPVSLRGRRVCG